MSPIAMVSATLVEVAILASPVVGAIAVVVVASHRDWIAALCLGLITGLGVLSLGILWPIGGQTWNALVAEVFVGDTLAHDQPHFWAGSLASSRPFFVVGSYLLVMLIPLTSLGYGQGYSRRSTVLTAVGLLVALTLVVAMRQAH